MVFMSVVPHIPSAELLRSMSSLGKRWPEDKYSFFFRPVKITSYNENSVGSRKSMTKSIINQRRAVAWGARGETRHTMLYFPFPCDRHPPRPPHLPHPLRATHSATLHCCCYCNEQITEHSTAQRYTQSYVA